MLALIRTLGPVVALLIGMLGGSTIIAGGAWLWNEWIDNPHVRELERVKQEAACTIRTLEAANRAEQAERARQRAAGDAALKAYQDEVLAREALRVSEIEEMEDDIARYEQTLAGEGRSCRFTDADFGRLRGQPGAAAGGDQAGDR